MKNANQVREYVRRRSLQEMANYLKYTRPGDQLARCYARTRELAFIEVLNAFDTPHKTKLKMPKMPNVES
jgi:hypothetical protein